MKTVYELSVEELVGEISALLGIRVLRGEELEGGVRVTSFGMIDVDIGGVHKLMGVDEAREWLLYEMRCHEIP